MPEEKKKLGEILLEAGVIDKFQLKSALAEQNKWGGRLGNHLVQMGILSEDLLVKALSKQLKIPNLDLSQMMVTADVLELVPHEIAEKFHLVPVAVKKIANKRTLIVAMSDPTNLDAVDELQFRTGHIIKPAVAGDTAIELAIRRYYYGELGPQRVAGQPIEFDPGRAAAAPPAVTNVPSAGVPIPPENEFALGDEPPAAASPMPAAVPVPMAPPPAEIPEASLADLGMDPPAAAWPPPAPEVAAPVWPAPEAPLAEPEPAPYDPAALSAVEPAPEPAYADPTQTAPDSAPEVAPLEPTYADPVAPEAAVEAAALEPTYADPAPPEAALEAAPLEPTYAEPVPAEPAAAWNGGTDDAPVWPTAAPEAPYPPEEPTVPADDGYAPAPVASAEPAPEAPADWSAPASEDPVWPSAAPDPAQAPVEAEASVAAPEPTAVEEPVWAAAEPPAAAPEPVAAAEAEPAPMAAVEPEPMPMAAVAEPSVEPSMDAVPLDAVEPGPAEAEVDRMEQVGAAGWNAGDAVQTFLGTTDGHPYEPTTPGEPTHAPEETSLAADGGAVAAAEPEPEPAHANGNGSAAQDPTQPDYVVPADPLGGIPFDTAEGRAIRALCALLLEKGLLTPDELASRLRTAVEGMGGGDSGEGLG